VIEVDGVWHDPDIINNSGLMYRQQYLIFSRTICEAMPYEWQERFVKLMEEIHEEFDLMSDKWVTPHYQVKAVDDNGRFMDDPWGVYRYPNAEYIESLRLNPERTKQRNLDYIKSTASVPSDAHEANEGGQND
jgi:hypothetical protein